VLLDGRKDELSGLEAVASRLEEHGAQVWLLDARTECGGNWVLQCGVDAIPMVLLLRNGKLVTKLLASEVTGKQFGRKAGEWIG
jgi:frataxin-like iron-binding protein CyaY